MHQEVGGNAQIFQDMDEHMRIIQEEYVTMGGNFMGETKYGMHLEKANIEPWYRIPPPPYKEVKPLLQKKVSIMCLREMEIMLI